MTNYDNIELTCNDMQKFAEILKKSTFHHSESDPKNGVVFIENQNFQLNTAIKQLSKENPDLVFTANYTYESEDYNTTYIFEYKKGEEKQIALKANYFITDGDNDDQGNERERRLIGDHWDKLYAKGIDIFRRIDITRLNENNEMYIDFVTGITLIIEDEDFQMQLSKGYLDIIIKCYEKEKVTSCKLVPVGSSHPFL